MNAGSFLIFIASGLATGLPLALESSSAALCAILATIWSVIVFFSFGFPTLAIPATRKRAIFTAFSRPACRPYRRKGFKFFISASVRYSL